MHPKIGIGIISFAHGHVSSYCNQMINFDDVKLVSCWDDNEERGKTSAEKFGMRYSPHLEDTIDNPEVDAVIIGIETNRHAEMTVAAAESGKDIVCQKPMALTIEDCDKMIDVIDKTGVKFTVAFQMRYDAANQKMKQLVDDGVIGKIGVLRRRHCISVLFNENFVKGWSKWHIEPEKNKGMFMDDASHAADFIYWLLGMPVSVVAEIDNILTNVAPDDNGVATYRFADGAMAILFNSSTTWAGENTTEIYGDKGVVIQNYGDAPSCNMPRPDDAVALKLHMAGEPGWKDMGIPIPDSHGERIAAVARPVADFLIDDNAEPHVSVRDGKSSTEMILGAYKSAQEGCRVEFPLR